MIVICFWFLAAGLHMRQISGLGISTQRATFITWHKYVCYVFFKMNLYSFVFRDWMEEGCRNVELRSKKCQVTHVLLCLHSHTLEQFRTTCECVVFLCFVHWKRWIHVYFFILVKSLTLQMSVCWFSNSSNPPGGYAVIIGTDLVFIVLTGNSEWCWMFRAVCVL